jgi:uncharacterized membrane protein YeaQ/YmgE (transglycosylase-associated protein family)
VRFGPGGEVVAPGPGAYGSAVLQAFLSAIVLGFAVGGLARWAVPGPDPMPAWLTILIGLTGSLVGGTAAAAIVGTGSRGDLFAVVMASIGVSALVVIAYRRFVQQRPVTGPDAMRLPKRGFGIPRLRQRLAQAGIDPDSVGAEGGPRRLPVEPREAEQQENLRKLEDLWRAGVLTDEEFQAKRAQLLDAAS